MRGLAIATLAAGGLIGALAGSVPAGPVAAVYPPWWTGPRAIAAASHGGAILRPGAVKFVVVVMPDSQGGNDRLRRAGAWLLLNPAGFIGCFTRGNI